MGMCGGIEIFTKCLLIHPNTGCPQKNSPVCFLSISPSNLHQIQKGRSVLKSAGPEDFKTVLDF